VVIFHANSTLSGLWPMFKIRGSRRNPHFYAVAADLSVFKPAVGSLNIFKEK
jgi:hypothetical protein